MKKIICLVLALIILIPSFVFAGSIEKKQEELESIQEKKAEEEENLGVKTEERDQVQSDIQTVVQRKQEVEQRIEENTVKIEEKEKELKIIREKLVEARAEVKEQQEEFADRLSVMYLNRSTDSKLAVLLQSESISDFLIRIEYFKKISDQDEKVLAELTEIREEIERLEAQEKKNYDSLVAMKKQLEEDREEQIALEKELEARKAELEAEISKIQEEIDSIAADEAAIAGQIAAIQEEARRAREAAAAEAAAREAADAEGSDDSGAEVYEDNSEEVSRGNEPSPAGFSWPAPGYYDLSSYYGYRIHPVLGIDSFHNGIDIPAPTGAPIVASRGGTVILATYYGSFGNCVIIDHGDGYSSLYAHGSGFAVGEGEYVSAGQTVLYCGSTGRSTGPHLHFSILYYGDYQDPLGYL